jgi:UDP-glucuronate decarboxylase
MNDLTKIIVGDAQRSIQNTDFGELHKKRILITGASGIIGVNLLACLRELTVDLSVTVVMQSPPFPYLQELCSYPNCTIVRGDITDIQFCQTLPKADYIIHAAGYGQPGRFMQNPIKTLQLNTVSTLLLFEKLLPGGKFLFTSTSELYSGLSHPPFTEQQIGTTTTTHPRACYIEGKRCGEAIVNAFREQGVNAKSARLSLVYGPGTRPDDTRVLNSFIQRALQGKIALLDKGEAKRTYCYISDAINMMWRVLLEGRECVYNIAGTSTVTIEELACLIGELTGVKVVFPEDDATAISCAPEDVHLSLNRYVSEFGMPNFLDLRTGLKNTIEWQKSLYA